MLQNAINDSLDQLSHVLKQLTDDQYTNCCVALSNATIGEHARHIIELFQCLHRQYESGIVNYSKRERNTAIQTNTTCAIDQISEIKANLDKEDKIISLQHFINGSEIVIQSNYNRELLYNLEHCVHHQALIKVAILQIANVAIDKDFGIASSTIEYRKQCAQ